jgi:hypothetical protein
MSLPIREHHHAADDTTLNALRHLRRPWRGWESASGVVRVQTADDGVVVRLTVAHAEPERGFRVRRIAADFEKGAVRPVRAVGGFDVGTNDVVILEGESWLTRIVAGESAGGRASDESLVTHGHPRERPARCEACCTTTDAVLVASSRGLTWLVRLGSRDEQLEVVTDHGAIRDFLSARKYEG